MGEVIASKAAADDIFADIETTFARAVARGGKWKEISESRLAPVRGVITALQARLSAAEAEFLPVKATIEAQDKRSDQLIGQISDEIWNAIGRPAFDPTFDVVFPGGIAHYTQGTNEDQPDRMELLAELLEMKLLSKVDSTLLVATVKRVRDEAAAYRKVVEAASQSRVRVQQLQRAKTAVAQSARMELAHLKRLYKAEGFSEADIHGVIPDRPHAKKAAPATSAVVPPPSPNPIAPTP